MLQNELIELYIYRRLQYIYTFIIPCVTLLGLLVICILSFKIPTQLLLYTWLLLKKKLVLHETRIDFPLGLWHSLVDGISLLHYQCTLQSLHRAILVLNAMFTRHISNQLSMYSGWEKNKWHIYIRISVMFVLISCLD